MQRACSSSTASGTSPARNKSPSEQPDLSIRTARSSGCGCSVSWVIRMGSKEQYPRYIAKDEQRQVVPRDERCRGAVTMPGQGMDEPDQDSPAEKQRTIIET